MKEDNEDMFYSIVLSDRFKVKKDTYCWQLSEFKEGLNKKTNEKTITEKKMYYPKLSQVLDHVLEDTVGECSNLSEIRDLLNKFNELVSKEADKIFIKDVN